MASYVHGDIRKENLLFSSDDNMKAWMLDFDLAGEENTRYPEIYNAVGIEERHCGAKAKWKRKKVHDTYALSVILEHFYSNNQNSMKIVSMLCCRDPNLLDMCKCLD